MLNPFIQDPLSHKEKERVINAEMDAHRFAHVAERPRSQAALWLGNLLIKMGEKLTEREVEMKSAHTLRTRANTR